MSAQKPKFLLDENVKKELFDFLKKSSYDVDQIRGLTNGKVAALTVKEKRVLVTNDSDFANRNIYPKSKIFSVILLRILQSRTDLLLKSFSFVLKLNQDDLEGKVFELKERELQTIQADA